MFRGTWATGCTEQQLAYLVTRMRQEEGLHWIVQYSERYKEKLLLPSSAFSGQELDSPVRGMVNVATRV
ncbi:MAG: hypothetical protein C7B46_10095 [Sulfobacillus benefaciens]|uniref:Uncharacterized protein n=1 Tax=Sulfobacillus benefaciens TaxID=453960 RepID=A0A2T2XFZ5_9FIRM|nr:MAG: hypothetical protein C7B46_10095 [Sulfobacillus benefaciens]